MLFQEVGPVSKHTGGTQLGGALISSQVVGQLLHELRRGCYSKCDRLPAEVELAARMQVSRTVIRDALSEMEREGFVERVRGIGTVVNRSNLFIKNRLDQKLEYNTIIREAGCTPHVDKVIVERMPAEAELAQSLHLPAGEDVLMICKRVKADETPVIYSVDHLPASLFTEEQIAHLDFSQPVFDLLESACDLSITSTTARISASCGTTGIRGMMHLGTNEALILLDEVSYTRLCRPVIRSLSYYTNFFDFSILRKKF